MGLIKITADMTESERTAVINTNMQYLQLSNRLRKYPIGMIVQFATDIDPNKLYGGTWERIKGRVIWGIEDGEQAGITGGEKEHTLTLDEMPKHRIDLNAVNANLEQPGGGYHPSWVFDRARTVEVLSAEVGGDQPHNNMMPYYGAYVWRKTGHGIGEDPTLTEYEAFVQQMNTAISEALSKERLITNATCANALKGNATGQAVRLSDVSPNEHTIGVKVSSKNSLNADDIKNTQNANIVSKGNGACVIKLSSTDKTTTIANLYKGHLPVGTYYFTAKLKIENTLGSTRDNEILVFYNDTVITRWYEANSGDGEYNVSKSFNVTDPSSEVRIDFYPTVNSSSSTPTTEYQATFTDIQLEYGNVATAYTPYISDLTTVNVTRYGKNFFDKDIAYADYDNVGGGYKGLNYYVGIGTTVTISLTETPTTGKGYMYVRPTISPGAGTQSWLAHSTVEALCSKQQTVVSTDGYISICMSTEAYNTFVEKIQIELGSAATEYEPYKTPTEYTPAADGTVLGVKSLYPTTTLMTDTEGAIIEAEYNRDINKAFAELQQAIISLGGNV